MYKMFCVELSCTKSSEGLGRLAQMVEHATKSFNVALISLSSRGPNWSRFQRDESNSKYKQIQSVSVIRISEIWTIVCSVFETHKVSEIRTNMSWFLDISQQCQSHSDEKCVLKVNCLKTEKFSSVWNPYY